MNNAGQYLKKIKESFVAECDGYWIHERSTVGVFSFMNIVVID